MTIQIVGLTSDDKVPGAYGETKFAQGRISVSSIPMSCVVIGAMLAAGSATADEPYDIFDEDQAVALFGARSEVRQMCAAALAVPGVNLKAVGLTEPGAGVQASLTATAGGSWATDGEITLWVGGRPYNFGVASTDTTSNVATNLAAAIAADGSAPFTASPAAAVATLTLANKGLRGNEYLAWADLSRAPAGLTLALVGGTALTGGVTPFAGGTLVEDISGALTALATEQYDRIACAPNDTTNADRLRDAVNAKAGPLVGLLENFVFAKARGLAAATTFSQTDLNEFRGQVYWLENSETVPSVIAAWIAAYRSVTEVGAPNPSYDDVEVAVAVPQKFRTDWPLHSELKSALNNGVSPLKTTRDGRVLIVRAITSHSLDGSTPDYRTLDIGEAVVPDRIRVETAAYWHSEFKVANPYVGPDPAGGAQPTPGVATPANWRASVLSEVLRPAEANNWITDVDSNLPQVEYNTGAKRLMSAIPHVVRPHQHQIGISSRQRAS